MSYCVVFGCNNRINKKNYEQLDKEKAANRKFSFHLFPRNVLRRQVWLKALNLQNYSPPKTATICFAHFKEEDYEQNNSLHKLKKDAVPYLPEERIVCTKEREEHEETNLVMENMELCEAGKTNNSATSIEVSDVNEIPTKEREKHEETNLVMENIELCEAG